MRRFLALVPNVENLKVTDDRQFNWFTSSMMELYGVPSMSESIGWLLRVYHQVDCYIKNQRPSLKHLKSLDFNMCRIETSAFSSLISVVAGADRLTSLSISIPAEADMRIFRQFLFNQTRLEVLKIQGFGIDEIFKETIPMVSYRLKHLEIYGEFSNIDGFAKFLSIHNEIEFIFLQKVKCRIHEAIFTNLKNLKQIMLSDRVMRRSSTFYKRIMKGEFELPRLEHLVIVNKNEETFPTQKILKITPNIKVLELSSLTQNHAAFLANHPNLERLKFQRFNPITLLNVKIENLKVFTCNDVQFEAPIEVWKSFFENHPKLENLQIGNYHKLLATTKRQLLILLQQLTHLKNLEKFVYESSSRNFRNLPLEYDYYFRREFDNQWFKVGIYIHQAIIRHNESFRQLCPEILTLIIDSYPGFNLVVDENTEQIARSPRFFPRIHY
jgi:hypothetical protein